MSDFDKDDWLRDNQPDDGDDEDDLSFDWLQDADQNDAQQAANAGHTGVTGELDWLRAMGDQDTLQADDDEHTFDWESEQPASGAAAPTGLTGMLDWQRQEDRFEQQLDDLESDVPDFFGGSLFDDQGEAEEARKAATDHLEAMFSTPSPPESEEDDNDEFLSALGLDIEPSEEDFLNALGLAPPAGVEQEIPGTETYDDTFDDIFGDVTDPFAAAAQQPEQTDEDDLFGQFDLDAPQATDTFTFDEELFAPQETPDTPAGINTGFLREVGAVQGSEEPFEFDDPFASQEDALSVGNTDFLSSVGLTPPAESGDESSDEIDWFNQFEEEAPPSASPDWLTELGADFDDTFGGAADQPALDEEPDFDALFSGTPAAAPTSKRKQTDEEPDFDALFGGTPAGKDKSASDDLGALRSEFDSLDDLLSSFDDIELPETGDLELELDTSGDFDSMLEATSFDELEPDRPAIELSPDAPEWLAGLAPSITDTGTSAAAIARQRKERPLDELDERLRHLREEGLNLPASASQPSEALAGVLPGVKETLPPADLTPGAPGLVGAVELRPEQRQKAAILQSLVGDATAAQYTQRSAIDATYDSPNMDFLEDEFEDPFAELEGRAPAPARPSIEEPEIAPAAVPERRARKTRRRRPIARILISLLILAAVLLPFFVHSLRIGELPPATFSPASPAWVAYQTVGTVGSGDLVLVAIEYGPTGAAELDIATDALLRHILRGGGRPVLIGTNATGLLHASNLLDALAVDAEFLAQIGRETPLQSNRDYYVLRYLTANAVGVRALSSNLAEVLATDVRGNPTRLADHTLADFALIVIIAERGDDLRVWMEQVAPLTSAPIVAAVGYSAAPLAQPYLNSGLNRGLVGLFVGYRDAYTYNALLDVGAPVLPDVPPTSTPEPTTPAPTEEPTQQSEEAVVTEAPTEESDEQPVATDEAVGSPTPEDRQGVKTSVPQITKTPVSAGADAEPSEAPQIEATVTERPTEAAATPTQTHTPTQEPTPTPTVSEFVRVATVNADTNVNVRELPSTSAPVVAGLAPGQTVRVIGESPDFQWFNILLPDGRQGWIAAFLVDIEDVPADEAPPLPPTPVGKRFDALPRSLKPSQQDITPTPEGFGDPAQLMTDAAATVTAAGVSVDDAFATATAFAAQPGFSLEDAAATATALSVQPGFSLEDAAATATALGISPDLSEDDVFATATALNISPDDAFATATAFAIGGEPDQQANDSGAAANITAGITRASTADTGLREERWYAMTLGLVVIVGIIGVSSAVHILRGLRRRGK